MELDLTVMSALFGTVDMFEEPNDFDHGDLEHHLEEARKNGPDSLFAFVEAVNEKVSRSLDGDPR